MTSWKRVAEVGQLVKRYGMSVAEAMDCEYPCGPQKGTAMRDVNHLSLRWLANIHTKMRHTAEFRRGVRAARIVLKTRFFNADEQRAKDIVATHTASEDAKHAVVRCRECSSVTRIRRGELDRKSTRCWKCGGMLEEDSRPVDEYMSLTDAALFFGVSKSVIEQAVRVGEIPRYKLKGKYHVGQAATRKYLSTLQTNRDLHQLGVKTGKLVCRFCRKRFRNSAAMKLHMREQHEDF